MAQPEQDSKAADANGSPATEPVELATGSDADLKDTGGDLAAPYGTRSRNRNGTSRPNYAEDKDMELDMYEDDPDKKDGDAKRPSRQANAAAANGEAGRAGISSRRSLADDARTASSQNGAKEQGASTIASVSQSTQASVAVQPSRKRKAASQQQVGVSSTTQSKKGSGTTQNSSSTRPDSNLLTFENCKARPENGRMLADDGTVLEANDHVYLVCEPPGEPYYLGRIMEFVHKENDASRPVVSVRVNWYYRPKDIGRKVHDTRHVFATMHSDVSPLTSLRGKCQIRHRVEIEDMELYRKTPDSFWYEKLYDRYIQKNYDLIPTSTIVNVPEKVKKVLDERWKYVLVEQGRGKELTSAVKLCRRCSGYCASNDSVDCAVCHNTYHMNCVKPPLLKKPSRGFAWSCAACSRAQERKLEAQHTPRTGDALGDADDDELLDEDEEDVVAPDTGRTTPEDDNDGHPHQGTAEQVYHASLWPYRYLGMHCKPEDALDYDDRIYPRASTRIGPRHQAAVGPWPGQPVQYVKPLEVKKNGRKDAKLSKEAQAALEAEKARRERRPKWVQDEPAGYVARGEDLDESDPNCTATLLWRPPKEDQLTAHEINNFMARAQAAATVLNLPERSTNLQDVAMETLFGSGYLPKRALSVLMETERGFFKEPNLSVAEQKRFEDGISKYGSELHLVTKHVKSMTPGEVVRYYYAWKKSDRGQQVWGEFSGRKGKKEAKRVEAAASKVADDVADHDDDSAFDTIKATEKKRCFRCQFCGSTKNRQWRRAPNPVAGLVNQEGKPATKDKGGQYIVALCRRCAELWRRYAVRFEDLEEVAKKVAQAGGRAWKRRQDEELLKELQAAQELGFMSADQASSPISATGPINGQEPPRKKLKSAPDRDVDATQSDGGSGTGSISTKKKDKEREKTSDSPAIPDMPKPRTLPCAICDQMDPLGDQHISCRECRLTVHRNCYGVLDNRIQGKWICDMCANDKNPQVSIHYKCVLCPVEYTEHDFVEQPKLTHHKKKMSEKDREKEKLDVQQARKAAEFYRKKQEDLNRPTNPREPLKRTADNNWVHVTCAVWTPEVKFGNAKAMEPSEGIPSIPRARYDEVCQACNQQGGACVACHQCRVPLHVECARHQDYVLGFDITPVKSSRRDQHSIVTVNGESGTMSAAIWCKDHIPTKTIVHRMHDVVDDSGLNALQFYAQNFKQADLTLTGTVRKANLMSTAAKMSGVPIQTAARRHSTAATTNGTSGATRNGDSMDTTAEALQLGARICISCGLDVSLKWWPIPADESQERELTNGYNGAMGSEARKFVEQRRFQCHKCHKEHRTPKPQTLQAPEGMMEIPRASPGTGPRDSNLARPMPPLRSPPALNHTSTADYRDGRPGSHAWPSHPPPQTAPHAGGPPQPLGVAPVSAAAPPTVVAQRPPPGGHTFSAAAPRRTSAYHEWGQRPGSQHGSPPRHLNGGPPPVNGAPLSTVTSLRPPAMSGPPPTAAPMGMPHLHGSPPFVNGLPPSPRRVSGPTAPAGYLTPFGGAPGGHGPPPPHGTPHAMSNGVRSPPPGRPDAFHHGLQPPRPAYSGPYGSPPSGSRNGPPTVYDLPPQPVASPSRPSDPRPPSGASSSASLRNLLS